MNRNFGHAQLERFAVEWKRPDIASQRQGLTSIVEWLFFHPKQGIFQQNPNYGLTHFLDLVGAAPVVAVQQGDFRGVFSDLGDNVATLEPDQVLLEAAAVFQADALFLGVHGGPVVGPHFLHDSRRGQEGVFARDSGHGLAGKDGWGRFQQAFVG